MIRSITRYPTLPSVSIIYMTATRVVKEAILVIHVTTRYIRSHIPFPAAARRANAAAARRRRRPAVARARRRTGFAAPRRSASAATATRPARRRSQPWPRPAAVRTRR